MPGWLSTLIIGLVIAGVLFAIPFSLIRNRLKGISSCGCDCAHCRAGCKKS